MSKETKSNEFSPMVEVEKFKQTLKDKTLEQLQELEKQIIAETDAHNEARMKKTFKMPAKNYKEAMTAIRTALETITVQWQYALGLKAMYEFFDPAKRQEAVEFPMLDSMLRTLGQASLKGYDQWCAVVTISEYFEPIREEYSRVGAEVYVDAGKHDAVVQEMQLHQVQEEVKEAAAEA